MHELPVGSQAEERKYEAELSPLLGTHRVLGGGNDSGVFLEWFPEPGDGPQQFIMLRREHVQELIPLLQRFLETNQFTATEVD